MEKVFKILLAIVILWTVIIMSIIFICPKANAESSKDFRIREQKFAECVASGQPRSYCQYLYR